MVPDSDHENTNLMIKTTLRLAHKGRGKTRRLSRSYRREEKEKTAWWGGEYVYEQEKWANKFALSGWGKGITGAKKVET